MKSLNRDRVRGAKFFLSSAVLLAAVFLFGAAANAISRGYQTQDNSLKPGMLVRLSADSGEETPFVERATEEDLQGIIGVATTVEESSITVASSGQTVFVESDGEVRAYVSDIYGSVKSGDQLSISPLNGILSASTENSRIILGTSLENFPEQGLQTYEIDTDEGKKTTNIALIRINLSTKLISGSASSDSSLQKIGRSVSGKEVSEIRVIVALVIFLLVLFAEGGILYGSTSSAMTSLGRNPLAGRIIRRQLIHVMLVAFGVLTIGLLSIYLILWV